MMTSSASKPPRPIISCLRVSGSCGIGRSIGAFLRVTGTAPSASEVFACESSLGLACGPVASPTRTAPCSGPDPGAGAGIPPDPGTDPGHAGGGADPGDRGTAVGADPCQALACGAAFGADPGGAVGADPGHAAACGAFGAAFDPGHAAACGADPGATFGGDPGHA